MLKRISPNYLLLVASIQEISLSAFKSPFEKTPAGPPAPHPFSECSLSELVEKLLCSGGEEGQVALMGSTVLLCLQHCCRTIVLHVSEYKRVDFLVFFFFFSLQNLLNLETRFPKAKTGTSYSTISPAFYSIQFFFINKSSSVVSELRNICGVLFFLEKTVLHFVLFTCYFHLAFVIWFCNFFSPTEVQILVVMNKSLSLQQCSCSWALEILLDKVPAPEYRDWCNK